MHTQNCHSYVKKSVKTYRARRVHERPDPLLNMRNIAPATLMIALLWLSLDLGVLHTFEMLNVKTFYLALSHSALTAIFALFTIFIGQFFLYQRFTRTHVIALFRR